ncbi:cadherin-99C-like isoform X2 [Amphibalanus amphitrite]|uniref:cadherin-99C-like isoform X2 n=1 Tax=Amphibalanus amphitrite TaxID=1232801 RepID=UPI001C8FFD89|nr:cadherin-99C-like isoform X2 [Amphibalanus amphitrite]
MGGLLGSRRRLLLSAAVLLISARISRAALCDVSSSDTVVIVDIMESLGDEMDQPTSPRELPIEGSSDEISLSLLPDATNFFRLEGKSLYLASPLDRDADDLSSIVLRVSCQVRASGYRRTIPVIVRVTDTNDNTPEFTRLPYRTRIPENTAVGEVIYRDIEATDRDAGINALLQYSLVPGDGGATDGYGRFSIARPHQGVVTLTRPLDFETTNVYYLRVVASDQAQPSSARRSATTTLTVQLDDSDDLGPGFVVAGCRPSGQECPLPSYRATVVSRELSGVLDVRPERIHAVDRDTLGADIEYRFISGQPPNYHQYFEIDLASGQVRQIQPVDRSMVKQFTITVQARERTPSGRSQTTELIIDVKAVDTSPPVVTITSPEGYVQESSAVGTKIMVQPQSLDVIQLRVDDPDWTPGEDRMQYRYELTTDAFAVDRDGYLVVARGDLDRDPPAPSQLTFQVVAREVTSSGPGRASLPATVTVHLLDVNDNSPQLPMYRPVRIAAGSGRRRILQVHATDVDEGANSDISYGVVHVSNNGRSKFEINSRSGDLDILQRVFSGEQYSITVQAADRGGRQSQTIVEVAVVPGPNSGGPVFRQSLYDADVSEGAGVGSTVLTVMAVDPEGDPVTYSLVEGTGLDQFSIGRATGTISVTRPLDREQLSKYNLMVRASDPDGLATTAVVNIRVSDINDKNPQFLNLPYTFRTREGETDLFVGRVRAVDEDAGANAALLFSVPESSPFSIDPTSGEIRTRRPLDYENQGVHYLVVTAKDGAADPRIATATATIFVSDTEDEPPVFRETRYDVSVPENTPYADVVRVQAVDLDSRPSIHYVIREGSRDFFNINPETGLITTLRGLDYERESRHVLVIGTEENRADSPDATATVIIQVEDRNDLPPVFTEVPRPVELRESDRPGQVIAALRAIDSDGTAPGNKVRYAVTGSGRAERFFTVNPETGDVSIREPLSAGAETKYELEVTAFDLGTPELSSSVLLPIFVERRGQPSRPLEPKEGVSFADREHSVELMENAAAGTLVKSITLINVPRSAGDLRCDVIGGDEEGHFSAVIRGASCEVRVATEPIDYEQQQRYRLRLRLRSSSVMVDPARDIATLVVNVQDRNDHRPEFIFSQAYSAVAPGRYLTAVDREAQLGTNVIRVQARDGDAGQYSRITFHISSDSNQFGYFDIDSESGIISTAKSFRSVKPEQLPFNLTVLARDSSSTGDIMETSVPVLINLITPENRMILVVRDAPPETVNSHQAKLIKVLQDLAGDDLVVGVERIDSRRYISENGSIETDPAGTDVWFYVIDPRSDVILTRRSGRLDSTITGARARSQIAYYLSAGLGARVEDVRGPLVVTPTVTTRQVTHGTALESYQVALLVFGCLIAFVSLCGIIHLCTLWSRYRRHRRSKSEGTLIIPKYEPYLVEPSLKEYETQVLQMSVPVDDDSVNDFQLDFRSDQPHYLNLDSISYITKDGNSSTGKDSGHATPSDHHPMRSSDPFQPDSRFDNKIIRSSSEDEVDAQSISATNENVTFRERRDFSYLQRSPVESTTEL